jgi:DNA-binding MarR family transcriptional regulator
MKISDLARYQRISKASISESIKLLVEHGWIKKIYDPEDKRVILLQVTDEGKEMMKSMWNKVSASLSKQLKQLPDNELEIIRESLRIMSNKFLKEN